ncbi:MAG: bifunctional demethylmenaquinone methyltransferase/2-methoxy-6-polyprenyl-1,4-benzoquinol methylase UbiE [Paludibacter sp.]|nr:bifunctional demethylmenaquinone methyltransferase/2-methoxy-6-polyprenyl-1,4-benzoquinol methylase UbiE [Paludibacter sp.]MDD4197859.1 bifunctional demethylmenaquinone methyltransferase/2-methoxy-6-polyprenyl-1,4-benzoquinol methylase UbiE [Paludibacter sp.]MDD4428151.1 bifunctional demethylmenaquinone methyltransferase/2-methoxy-6-polyprenyl-1,4-benzoquinol methylase UbiE [Paludibacter sp.]
MTTKEFLNDEIKPYNPHEDKTNQLVSLFDKISSHYDRFNNVISWGMAHIWRRKSVAFLKKYTPEKILDIATGTADMILVINNILKPKTIIGIDISAKMMEIGRQKVMKKQLASKVDFQIQNAASLSFENNTFDAVTIAFGIRNFEKLSQSMYEINRVLKPNGHFLILEVNQPQKGIMLLFYKFYISIYMLFVTGMLDKADYNYLTNSMGAFPRGEKLIEILQSFDFKLIKYKRFTFDVCSAYLLRKTN